MTVRLSYEAVVHINQQITGDCVIRDAAGLDAALHRPFHTFGEDLFPTVVQKAAVLLHSLATAHAFKDGNKRTAWTSCLSLLGLNGITIEADQEEAGQLVLDLVEHRLDHPAAALWLAARIE
jgi:death-on-curing protein